MTHSTKPPTMVQDELTNIRPALAKLYNRGVSVGRRYEMVDKLAERTKLDYALDDFEAEIRILLATIIADAEREARIDELERATQARIKGIAHGISVRYVTTRLNQFRSIKIARELEERFRTQATKPEQEKV